MKHYKWMGLAAALLLCACVTATIDVPDAKERGLLSTKMVNLSSAVDAYFSELPEAPLDDDLTILQKATRHDSRLLAEEFKPYILKAQYQQPYAVLLLCTKDGKRAIMEDAGCSARLDRQVVADDVPCEFTLHILKGCEVIGADLQ